MVQTVSTRFGLVSCLAVVSLTLVGCVDAREAFDDYGSRLVDAGGDVDGDVVTSLPDVDGEFLVSVRPNLPEDRIIRFRVTFDLTGVTENTGTLDISATALTVADATPIGDAFVANDAAVGNDASFDAEFEGILAAEANPVTPGQPARIDAQLVGSLENENLLCGHLSGTAGTLVLGPSDTWAAVRITGDTLPDPVWECPDAQ